MSLEDLLERGEQLARDAEKEIDDLLAKRAEIDETIRRVRAYARLIGPQKPHKKKATTNKSVSPSMLVRVAKACMVLQEERQTFTVAEASESLGVHETTVRFAFAELHDREFLRKLPGRIDRREHYAVMDAHVLDMLTANASENGNGPKD